MSRPMFACYVVAGSTLVRGLGAKRALELLGHRPRWSVAGRGWVVRDAQVCHDLQALANRDGAFVAISHRRPT